jgi:hypothetical protein
MQSWAKSKCAIMSSVVFESNECRGYKRTDTLAQEITVSSNRILLAKMMQRNNDLFCLNFLHLTVTLTKSGRVALSELPNWLRLATESLLIQLDWILRCEISHLHFQPCTLYTPYKYMYIWLISFHCTTWWWPKFMAETCSCAFHIVNSIPPNT